MEYLQHLLIGHQLEKRLQIDAGGQRVDDDSLLGACHLEHAEQGIIGGFPQKLGVHGDDRMSGEAVAGGCELRGGANHVHKLRRSAESADLSRVSGRIRALHLSLSRGFWKEGFKKGLAALRRSESGVAA